MTKTGNYQLNQWEAADPVRREDFNADNAKLDAALAKKAEVTALTALQNSMTAGLNGVNTELDGVNSDLAALEQTVNSDLAALESSMNADLAALEQAMNSDMSALETSMNSELSGVNTELAALAADLGSAGANARVAWGSYVGDSTSGASYPTSLTFDFKPLLVVVLGTCFSGNPDADSSIFLRPANLSTTTLYVTWSDRGLNWYSTDASIPHTLQLNDQSFTYYYLAIGVDE